jgi:hypothetical protein
MNKLCTGLHCLFLILLPVSSGVLSFLAAGGVLVDADSDLAMAEAPSATRAWSRRGLCTSDLWPADEAGSSSLVPAASWEITPTEARSAAPPEAAWLPAAAPMVRSCSTKRSCTMVRSGIRSLAIACARTSGDSFLQSISRHNRFLSALLSSGCSCSPS